MATIVCVVGDKGGTGKSTWARGLADLYRFAGRPVALFDGDWLARSLFKFHRAGDAQGRPLPLDKQDPRRGCILYDARDRRYGHDLLLNSMAFPGVEVILHDLPAGFRTDIGNLMSIPNPAEAVKEFAASVAAMGHRLVLVNVMTPSPSDHHTAPWLAETVGDGATVIAVRNGLFDAASFAIWHREAAKSFRAAGGVELEMPGLDGTAAILCDHRMLRFTAAIADDRLALADRMRVLSWFRRFTASVAPAAKLLQLPQDIVERVSVLRVDPPVAEAPQFGDADTLAEAAAPPETPAARMPDTVREASMVTATDVVSTSAVEMDGEFDDQPESEPLSEPRAAARPRGPTPRRPLSELLGRAKRAANGGSSTDGRFLLASDRPIM